MPEEELAPQEEPETEAEETPEETEETPEEDTTIDDLATEMGWKPQDDFQGHEDDYVDSATYIRRSKDIQDSMRQHLKENKRTMASMQKGFEDLKAHNERVYKADLKKKEKEIVTLQEQRKEAIEEGDIDQVDKLEGEMSELLNETLPPPKRHEAPEIDPEQYTTFAKWQEQNQWYGVKGVTKGNDELTNYANYLSELPEYSGLSYERKLMKVTEKVREMHPDHFKGKARGPNVNPVEAPRPSGKKAKHTARDLNDDQRNIMRNFVKRGLMTEKEYINDLAKIGELG